MRAHDGIAIVRTGILAVLVLAFAPQGRAQTPPTHDGEPVMELRFDVRGTPIVLHATDSGFVPEHTDRMTMEAAGPLFRKGDATTPPRYRWAFSIAMRDGARPARVRIEEIERDVDTLLVDDGTPAVRDGVWTGSSSTDCDMVPSAPCAAWIFASGAQVTVFRATVTFDDGVTQTLYQGTGFYPERMPSLWKDLGVAR